MLKINIFIIVFILSFFTFGCLATRQDIMNTNLEMLELRKQLTEQISKNISINLELKKLFIEEFEKFQTITADLRNSFDNQTTKFSNLDGKIDEGNTRFDDIKINNSYINDLNNKLALIEEKLYNISISTSNNLKNSEEIYQSAREEYARGNYDLAIEGFKNIITNFSDSQFVENAYYDLSISFYAKKEYDKVLENVNLLISKFPETVLLSRAYLLKAKALKKLGDFTNLKKIYQEIIEKFPMSEEAKVAKDDMDKMRL